MVLLTLLINRLWLFQKEKHLFQKKRMRRSHHKLTSANIIEDKKSGEYKLSHHIDLKSGYYNGKKILDI